MHEIAIHIALNGLMVTLVLAVLTWLVSLIKHDVSIVDGMWSIFIAGAAGAYALQTANFNSRSILGLLIVFAWAIRLSAYITWRNHGNAEDRRYQQIRARNQPHFSLKSLYLVFALQALLAWMVSLPLLAMSFSHSELTIFDAIGAFIALFGLAFETIGDFQMAAFKSQLSNRGRVMDRGLWRYTRHPNYFGECCVWWGLFVIASAGGGGWSIVSPLLMTVLLLKVSGVTLLEADIAERRPAYRDYVLRTSAFVPRRPRRETPP